MGTGRVYGRFTRQSAELFERHASTSPYNSLYDRPNLLELLGDVARKKVLDAGCGPGLYVEELLRRGATVVGYDQSPDMIDLARRRLGDLALLRVHDLNDSLDWLEAESFDLAVMALVIHHLDDPVAALRHIHRILRPQGRLVLSTHHPLVDWRHRGGSYFDVEVIEETWAEWWDVRYWRKPLTASCAEFAEAGFWIERLVEPVPIAEMAEADPERYQRLRTEPGFIMFRLAKVPA